MTLVFTWDRCGRKGEPCRVVARSRPSCAAHAWAGFVVPPPARVKFWNTVAIEFADGFTMTTSGNALRRAI